MKVCLLASGSNGNGCYVESGDVRLLIDVGIGPRTLAKRMAKVHRTPTDLTHLLITHEHVDHISGLQGVLKRCPGLVVCATRGTLKALPSQVSRGAVQINSRTVLDLGPLTVYPFRTSHDCAQPSGFRIEGPDAILGYATDLGMLSRAIVTGLSGCTGLFVEANHCPELLRAGPYPHVLKTRVAGNRGHLSNLQCRELLEQVLHPGLTHVTLAHLSAVNNSPEAIWAAMGDLRDASGAVWSLGSRTSALEPVMLSAGGGHTGRVCPRQLDLGLGGPST